MQFRALSDQLYRSPDYHRHVRKEIVKQVCQSPGHIGRNTFQIYVNKLIWLNCKFLYAATHAFPLCYFVALCLTVLVCLLSCESIKNFFLIVDLFFCETRMLTLHMLFFSLCSSRNVTPCTKVMFQWNINIIARKWRSMYFPTIRFATQIVKVRELVFVTIASLTTIFSRSGEWGDHVTLQAAADKVNFLLPCYNSTIICLASSHNLPWHCKISNHYTTMQIATIIFKSYWNTKQWITYVVMVGRVYERRQRG